MRLQHFSSQNDFNTYFYALKNQTNSFFVIDKLVHSLFYSTFQSIAENKLFILQAKEENKSIEKATKLWQWLSDKGANRSSTIVAIGGGIITDLVGFVASTFKRGCNFVAIPTTLLAMVDASIGGKTAINFNGLKNGIGSFYRASEVVINQSFLATLSDDNLFEGLAEMLKYGFISSPQLLKDCYLLSADFSQVELFDKLIHKCIEIKLDIVESDLLDRGLRHKLNFGHTIGHAFEEFFSQKGNAISHGMAVAWGMVCELYLSLPLGFPKEELIQFYHFVQDNYPMLHLSCNNSESLYNLMLHDKKNTEFHTINCTLLRSVGEAIVKQHISKELFTEALEYIL